MLLLGLEKKLNVGAGVWVAYRVVSSMSLPATGVARDVVKISGILVGFQYRSNTGWLNDN